MKASNEFTSRRLMAVRTVAWFLMGHAPTHMELFMTYDSLVKRQRWPS